MAAHGQITLVDAATIQTAVRFEITALLARRWLIEGVDELTHSERLQFAREIARASAERDRCLRSLGLGRQTMQTLDALYTVPVSEADDEPGDDSEAGRRHERRSSTGRGIQLRDALGLSIP